MRLRNKILLVIFLATLVVWLFGCKHEHLVSVPAPTLEHGRVDMAYMKKLYAIYNEGYFQNRLPKDTIIDMSESNPNYMASTICNDDVCEIHFNQEYVVAARTAQLVMLHEACHVKTWNKDVATFGNATEQVDHGRHWRACMLELDVEGANREILIDNYNGD